MSDLILNPITLVECVALTHGFEPEDFPKTLITVYGQVVDLIDGAGNWTENLHFEHVGYVSRKIKWADRFHHNDYVEWIIRGWTIDRLEHNLNIKAITAIHSNIDTLNISGTTSDEIAEQLFQWCEKLVIGGALKLDQVPAAAARSLYEWGLEEDLSGFSEHRLFSLSQVRKFRNSTGTLVTIRDSRFGPFTRTELSFIEAAMNDYVEVTATERAAYYLARDWGLRPIQMALLHVSDYGTDELGPFISVPCVKGTKRSILRRAKSNFVKRYIADDTAEAIQSQIPVAHEVAASMRARIGKFSGEEQAAKLETPLFPAKGRSDLRLERYCRDPKVFKYSLHCDSHTISKLMRDLTWKLRIPKTKTEKVESDDYYLNITAYRFRRTKGTSMVLAGATPEDVAEALDHVSVDSIKYYFRYNLELHDFINRAHSESPDIVRAVEAWGGRLDNMGDLLPNEIKIGSLGKCTRGSACPYHPTVSCYSCQNFKPSKNADHRQALIDIQNFKNMIRDTSTGPINQQLETAIHGAKSVILAIKHEDRSTDAASRNS
ncbi:MAG TPA: site-specific integrase [Pseudomonas sp.]|uniref:site-specific integrase n=1 Tax=Pseudomonas sp. TaxID=306 RepID=UPI002B488609|nr:site-specific integrase [Pseudomonas sp.]HKS15006.1 site-specific integrase [Pseudomonas sp.]